MMKKVIKEKYLLSRGRKYTKLFSIYRNNMNLVSQWYNEDIDKILGSWNEQVEHFENNLK